MFWGVQHSIALQAAKKVKVTNSCVVCVFLLCIQVERQDDIVFTCIQEADIEPYTEDHRVLTEAQFTQVHSKTAVHTMQQGSRVFHGDQLAKLSVTHSCF